jgi:hypothetical protein
MGFSRGKSLCGGKENISSTAEKCIDRGKYLWKRSA